MLTIAAVAENKGIQLGQIDVQIQRQTAEEAPWRTSFAVQVDLGEGLSHRERVLLFNSARHCEVHKLLDGAMTFEYQLSPAGG